MFACVKFFEKKMNMLKERTLILSPSERSSSSIMCRKLVIRPAEINDDRDEEISEAASDITSVSYTPLETTIHFY